MFYFLLMKVSFSSYIVLKVCNNNHSQLLPPSLQISVGSDGVKPILYEKDKKNVWRFETDPFD